jgi:hypothetical protein
MTLLLSFPDDYEAPPASRHLARAAFRAMAAL